MDPAASGGRQGGVCGEDLGGERGRASLGWWVGHAGAWGRSENPTRELLESPVAASHFTGEGPGREPIKSECAAAAVAAELLRTAPESSAREAARGGGSPRSSHPPLSLCLSPFLPLVPDPRSVQPLRPHLALFYLRSPLPRASQSAMG